MGDGLTIANFLDNNWGIDLKLNLIAGKVGLHNRVLVNDINRPGLTLSGFFDCFAYDRIQIFGLGETAFVSQLDQKIKEEMYSKFFSYDILCCIFTHNEMPDELFIKHADENNIPVMITEIKTTRFISLLIHYLDEVFAPKVTLHATFVDVFGVGILIMGKSGIGKSETALELIERGHRLVGDDMITVTKSSETSLRGCGSPLLMHNMEIRGLGIIDIHDIFGIRSVRESKKVELIVMLEEWNSNKEYDRLGLDTQMYSILDVNVPLLTVPVKPGRNIPIIIETAALNEKLKKAGKSSAKKLDERIKDHLINDKKSEKSLNG